MTCEIVIANNKFVSVAQSVHLFFWEWGDGWGWRQTRDTKNTEKEEEKRLGKRANLLLQLQGKMYGRTGTTFSSVCVVVN